VSVRLSDRLAWPGDVEVGVWACAAIQIWKADADVRAEFSDLVAFFDWSYATAEKILRSVEFE
jgi:hypothetical protein